MSRQCKICGSEFTQKGKRKYCDKCRGEIGVMKVKCKQCENMTRSKTGLCITCRKAKKETIQCGDCGKTIEYKAGNHKYCDECSKKRKNKYDPKKQWNRRQFKECQKCGVDLKKNEKKYCADCAEVRTCVICNERQTRNRDSICMHCRGESKKSKATKVIKETGSKIDPYFLRRK
jgi:hypothetical protein